MSEIAGLKKKQTSFQVPSEFKGLVFVRYMDHVLFNRASALALAPQLRDAVGWLVYECSEYITVAWDRDVGPPTLKNGDPKASGLVLLKSAIVEMKLLQSNDSSTAFLKAKTNSKSSGRVGAGKDLAKNSPDRQEIKTCLPQGATP